MASGPIETHLHRSFNWENAAPGAREGPRGRSASSGNGLSAQCVRLRSEINHQIVLVPCGRADLACGKRCLTSKNQIGEMLKMGLYKRLGGEFKNFSGILCATGLHFATKASAPSTCELFRPIPVSAQRIHKSVKLLVSIWSEHA